MTCTTGAAQQCSTAALLSYVDTCVCTKDNSTGISTGMDICEGSLNVFSGWSTSINILAAMPSSEYP